MTAEEFAAWSNWMKTRRGMWSIDPIHNGQDRDLIAFIPSEEDESRGVYVMASANTMYAGRYHGAIPHMGDATYDHAWGASLLPRVDVGTWMAPPTEAVLEFITKRLGLPFILGTACNVPARSCRGR